MAAFKVAVLELNGEQTVESDRLRFYYQVPSDYDFAANLALNVTSVQTLKLFVSVSRLDYKNYRSSLAVFVGGVGFSSLSDVDKKEAAAQFVVSAADRNSEFSTEEQVELGAVFHANSILARSERYRRAASEVYNRLSGTESAQIIGLIISKGLDTLYMQYGIEGTASGDVEGLYDYLDGTGSYSAIGLSPGLRHKTWVPIGLTITELSDRILSILRGEV